MKNIFVILLLINVCSIEVFATNQVALGSSFEAKNKGLIGKYNFLRPLINPLLYSSFLQKKTCQSQVFFNYQDLKKNQLTYLSSQTKYLDLNVEDQTEPFEFIFEEELKPSSIKTQDKKSNTQGVSLSVRDSYLTYDLTDEERQVKLQCYTENLQNQKFYEIQAFIFKKIKKKIDQKTLISFSKLSGNEIYRILLSNKNIDEFLKIKITKYFRRNNHEDLEYSPYW